MMNMIIFGSMIWIPALIAYMLINETKFKKNIVIGVTLPKEAREDETILRILGTFRKQEILICVILMALGVLCMFFVKSFSFTIFMIWTLMCVGAPYIPYILTNIRLKEYKQAKGWGAPKRTVYTDTAAQVHIEPVNSWLFLPPCVIALIPVLWDRTMWFLYVLFAVLCVLFWLSCRWLYRNRPEMVDENTDITNSLSRMRRYNWSKMWLVCSWLMALMSLCAGIDIKWTPWGWIAAMVLIVLLTVYAIRIEMKTRAVQEKLTKDSGEDWYVDEDDRWLYGLLYYNPDDSRTIINNRVGLNSTVNIARPLGKLLIGMTALILAVLPFMGIYFDQIDTKPINAEVSAETFEIKNGMTDYKISVAEIDSLELCENLLTNLRRRAGTGMEHLLKGSFSADETGNVTVLIDPTVEPYILIQTEDGEYWFFGTRDGEMTEQLFEQLKEYTGQ